ncbi:peptide deformylase [Zopfochytrium polystomum]|nr:peptide deformylase [Zopfochytrium polystomum]
MSFLWRSLAAAFGFSRPPRILQVGHPLLRVPSRTVSREEMFSEEVKSTISKMNSVFTSPLHRPVGLAAPQIGSPLRIIAFKLPDQPRTSLPTVLINPVIEMIEAEEKWTRQYESCESMQYYNAIVRRPNRLQVRGIRQDGSCVKLDAKGFLARILHHEIDHLDGMVFADRMEPKSIRHDNYIGKFELPVD